MKLKTSSNGIIFGSTGILGSKISLDLAQMNTNLILHGKSIKKLIKLGDETKKFEVNKIKIDVLKSNLISKLN